MGDLLKNPKVCLAHHMLGVFSAAGSFWWTACIAMYVFFTLYYAPYQTAAEVGKSNRDRYSGLFHLLSWGYPTALLIPYAIYELHYQYPQVPADCLAHAPGSPLGVGKWTSG